MYFLSGFLTLSDVFCSPGLKLEKYDSCDLLILRLLFGHYQIRSGRSSHEADQLLLTETTNKESDKCSIIEI